MIKNKEEHKNYWSDRAKREGRKTVGFAGLSDGGFDIRSMEWEKRFAPYWKKYIEGIALDFGCGVGRFTEMLCDDVIGIDLTKELLEIAQEDNPDVRFIHMKDPFKIPLDNDIIKSLWCCTVLQHLVVPGNVEAIVGEFYRILDEGGRVLFYENTAFGDALRSHIYFRKRETYENIFKKAGFKRVKVLGSFIEDGNEEHTLFLAEK